MLGSTPSGLSDVCWQLLRGFSECPLGQVWSSLPHLVSNPLGVCWQLLWGFPGSPEVGCGLPYHISSRLSGSLLATASAISEVPLGRVWPSLPHLVSNPLGVCWQLLRGFSECPLGRGWSSLPHLVSNSLGVCWQLLCDPNSTELNNNSTPTRSPTGSLKSNV